MLKPLLPKKWEIVTVERDLDIKTAPVLRISQQSIVRHPQAPLGSLLVSFIVQIIAPGIDFSKSEDLLDDDVMTLIFAIDSLGGSIAWTSCQKGQVGDSLAYVLDLTITVDKP